MRRVAGLITMIALVIAAAYFTFQRVEPKDDRVPAPAHETPTASIIAAKDVAQIRTQEGRTAISYSSVVGMWSEFPTWSAARQLDAVTELQDNPGLDASIVYALQLGLGDRNLEDVTRNNIANALLNQDKYPSEVTSALRGMIDNTGEGLTWRAYAVQHLATAFERTGDAMAYQGLLAAASNVDATISSTAIIQLDRLDSDQVRPVGVDFDRVILDRYLRDPNDMVVACASLSVMGRRGAPEFLPVIRTALASSDPHIRRVAIGALGLIGDHADLPALDRETSSKDRLVALAARSAQERIIQRSNTQQ